MIKVTIGRGGGSPVYRPDLLDGASWETEIDGMPGRFAFRILDDPELRIAEGDRVEVTSSDGHNLFRGNIFTRRTDHHGVVSVVAYDQTRYLKNCDTISYKDITASDLLRRIAAEHGLEVGRVDDTGVVLPAMVEDNKTLADIIHNALRKTEEAGGERFALYDDFGKLTLVPASEMRLDAALTDDGGTGFLRTISIDKDTYNNVKLVRDTRTSGRQFFTESDAGNTAQWGKLQYFAKVGEDENATAKANSLLNLYNKEQRTLSVDGVHGHPQVRAGCSLMVSPELSGNPHGNACIVERAIHRWANGRYSMDLELRMIRGGNPTGGEARALGWGEWALESTMKVVRRTPVFDRAGGVSEPLTILSAGNFVSVNVNSPERTISSITWINISYSDTVGMRTGWVRKSDLESVSLTPPPRGMIEFEVTGNADVRVRSGPGGALSEFFLIPGQKVHSHLTATGRGVADPWKNTEFRLVYFGPAWNLAGWVPEENLRAVGSGSINNGLVVHERVIQQPTSIGYNLASSRQLSQIDRITVHHTVGAQNPSISTVNSYWTTRADGSSWSRAGYHFLIRGDGSIWQLVPIHTHSVGTRFSDVNTRSIQISFAGDFRTPNLPTQAAIDSFRFLRRQLVGNAQLPNLLNTDEHIVGHREWRNGDEDDCPGIPRATFLSWT